MPKQLVSILPLGGQDEMGKSMYCIEVNHKIFIIDAGYRFPESEKLGIDIIIPSFQYLIDREKDIAAIIITHGHDDTMAALPYLLNDIKGIPIYAPSLTGDLIEQMIDRYERHHKVDLQLDLHRVRRNDSIKIKGIEIEFFPVTHSIPGSVGVAINTKYGYIVYGGEFIIDFGAPDGFKCDIQKMMKIGNKGVLAMLMESSYAKRDGYTSPEHKLTRKIESLFEDATGRIIITSYAQNVFRTKEIVELVKKYHRKIVFYGHDKYDNTNTILRLEKHMRQPIINIEDKYIGKKENIGIPLKDRNYVILLSGAPSTIYSDIQEIIDGGDNLLKLRKGDTFIVASPVLPGTEKIAVNAINNLYRTDVNPAIFKNKDLSSMHASTEDIKVCIQIFNPKYYLPIKGEYQHFIANANIASDMNIDKDHIIILDNGDKVYFENGELLDTKDHYEIEDIMIDGYGIGDVGLKVIDDRIQLANDGVVIIGLTIDKNKNIIAKTDCQTRGFVYLKDFGYIIKNVIDICEEEIENWKHTSLDIQDVRNIMRERSIKYIRNETGKRPVFIAVIIEV